MRKTPKPRKILCLIALAAAAFLAVRLAYGYYPVRHMEIINENAALFGIEASLICGIIHSESRFSEFAVSPKNASGLMQVTRPTAEWIAGEAGMENFDYADIFDPVINIRIGCHYLKWLLNRYENRETAVAAYNAGNGNVDRWLGDRAYSADGITLSEIPFPETRAYVARVNRSCKAYGRLIPLYSFFGRFI